MLKDKGANVKFNDPYFKKLPPLRKYNFELENISLTPQNVKKFDLIILITDHDSFDYEMIEKNGRLIIDTRGRFKVKHNVKRS